MKRAIAGLVLAAWAQSGWSSEGGGFWTGNGLLRACDNGNEANACVGYVAGIVDTYQTVVTWEHARREICVPEGATITQHAFVVIKYLKEHPEELHLAASSLALTAFAQAFPCK